MDIFYTQKLYQSFENELKKNTKLGLNFVILTLPGLGATYFIKKFLEKQKDNNTKYIAGVGEELSNYNILDLNFDKNEDALGIADEYFRKANLKQKFAVVINTPYFLNQKVYKETFLASHVYKTYYFHVREKGDNDIFALEINPALNKKELEKIYDLTGGIGRFTKFFALNRERIFESEILHDDLLKIIEPTVEVVKKCDTNVLLQIGVFKNTEFGSEILRRYFVENPIQTKINIEINADLTFSENGEKSSEVLTKNESDILSLFLISNVVKREQIADVKWGEDSYDDYSDQAINKTMQRLNSKLHKYQIVPIPKVGYKIETI